jgi:hypothetical protein
MVSQPTRDQNIFSTLRRLLNICGTIFVFQQETPLQKIKSKSRFCHISKTVLSHLKVVEMVTR